ncbi:DUF4232 domain-containing protein [Streptomyces sp. NPDC057456]|uniref:DUF4232 domain-containing protein n=1 Tax=Streptomyces sp. NPDC057456 TaxID=3346139 RepID=UPI0036B500B7
MNTAVRKNRERSRSAKGWKSCAVGAAAIGAMLASTACEPSAADDAADSTASGRPSATSPAKPGSTGPTGTTGSATPGSTGSATPSGGSGATGGGGGGGAVPACAAEDLSFGTTLEDGKGEVPKHLLITVTNAGDERCVVHHYPHLFLGDYAEARYPIDVYEDSDPKAPVTLAPGDEAYAALLASGVPMDQYETNTITLLLHGRELGSDGSGPIGVDLPRTVAFDDGARVTYWTTASGFALDFIMSS